jgi:O-antigen/teichoic acid export membrane protein
MSDRVVTIERLRRLAGNDVARGSIGIIVASLVNAGLGYVFWVIAARAFDADNVGAASAVMTSAALAAVAGDLGARTHVIHALAGESRTRVWSRIVTSSLVVAGGGAGVASFVVWLVLRSSSPVTADYLAAWLPTFVLLAVAMALFNVLDGVDTVERLPGQLVTRSLISSVGKVVIVALIAMARRPLEQGILVATVAAFVAAVIWGLTLGLRKARREWRPTVRGIGSAVRAAFGDLTGHHLLNVGGQLPTFLFPLEVVYRLSAAQNAYFYLTWMLGSLFMVVSPAVSSALFAQGRRDPTSLGRSVRVAVGLIAALLVPAALFMIVFGRLVLTSFGPDYADEGYVLMLLLVASALPDAVTNVQVGIYRSQGRVWVGAALNLSMGVAAVGVAWPLLPSLGIEAVGWSWLGAQTAGALATFVIGRHRSPGRHRVGDQFQSGQP